MQAGKRRRSNCKHSLFNKHTRKDNQNSKAGATNLNMKTLIHRSKTGKATDLQRGVKAMTDKQRLEHRGIY